MKINRLVLAAAVVYGAGGLALVFLSREILGAPGAGFSQHTEWLAQIAGGGMLGLALMNWLQRFSVVGGILGRPLLLANLMFTSIAFFASVRAAMDGFARVPMVVVTAIAGALLIGFGMRLFRRTEA